MISILRNTATVLALVLIPIMVTAAELSQEKKILYSLESYRFSSGL